MSDRTAVTARGADFTALLLDSHLRLVGAPLCPQQWRNAAEAADWLYNQAPFGLLAHDTSADPRFVYANRTAQRCFGYTEAEFTGLPSRLSAAPDAQEDRDAFVDAVNRRGFADGYRGRRVRKDGSLFWIEDVCMWDLVDADGHKHGQAAVFRSWSDVPGES
ncbi:MEKHLA domain-containing protein [Streptomyces sp. Ru62]|uniref:MEKHLA domain-containing protein n=1 Tax=Streptomyces sp. Ru62 TaxID=2080745 RepID=UPI000CDDFAA2|nr:MEKHLA domain-containing protein [Streptomyces sp. Ru62]POX64385.1 MEKHLA domain-containing protein [Streptomyces sp. Ru62]